MVTSEGLTVPHNPQVLKAGRMAQVKCLPNQVAPSFKTQYSKKNKTKNKPKNTMEVSQQASRGMKSHSLTI
jgi:hypothetical protein